MSNNSNSILLLIIYIGLVITKKKHTRTQKITTTNNKTVQKISAKMDRSTSIQEKQIWGYIIRAIPNISFHATPSMSFE